MTGDFYDNGLPFLSDSDRAALETGSAIRPEVLAARGYGTVQDKRDLPHYGFEARNGAVPCLLVPLHSADGETIVYQIRPHTPRLDKNGKPVKYEIPSGGRLVVDCNPMDRAEFRNPDVELWVTEGSKKADAAISHGLACVSLSGVDCWRDKNGPLACWESIPLKNRNVVLAFDGDFRANPRVYRALKRFSVWLKSRGAAARFCLLPESADGKKIGLDDFFAQGGNVAGLRERIADELPPLDMNEKLALLDCTDTGNAERLAARFGEDLRYCHTWKSWLVWNGRYWERDETGQALEYAKKTARAILAEAAATTDDAQRSALAAWSKKTQCRVSLLALVDLAKTLPEIGATAEQFDADGWALNVENGTLDLQTGCLREPERDDLMTKSLRVPYDPDAACPTWTGFLASVQPDADVRAFLARAVGYCLTGSICEHVLFFNFGEGQNGKSTFTDALAALAGDYGTHIRADVLMLERGGPNRGSTPELAALRGSRFASVSEITDGQRMDEALVKSLTGGDPVTARAHYQAPETFAPTFKFWLSGNHKPRICGTDTGIWRRQILIPFAVQIPDAQRDKTLPEKLRAELPGILAWAVRGALQWRRDGLAPPPSVMAATAEYRREMDALAPFYEEVCVAFPNAGVTKSALWQSYQTWADNSGERAYRTQRAFNAAIKRRAGVREGVSGHESAKTWFGIGLKSDATEGENDEMPTVPTEPTENPKTFSYTPYAYANLSEIGSARSARSASAVPAVPPGDGKPLEIKITPSMRQEVETLAKWRTRENDGTRAPSADHGSDAENLRYDFYGMAAERVLIGKMEDGGLTPENYVFLAGDARERRKMAQPDFTLRGLRYDVKSCPPGKQFACVNAGKHENRAARPDFYALCLFQNDEAFTVAIVPAADVDAWEKRDGVEKPDGTRRKPYFSANKNTLPLITSLDEFAPKTEGKKWT